MRDAAAWLAFGLNRRHKLLNSHGNMILGGAISPSIAPLVNVTRT